MPSDYDQIRAENILEYGQGTRHLAFLERIYSYRGQFLFEILQNAEDSEAEEIRFTLHADRLEVRHNGRPFNEQDVRGVCGVGEGTKESDLTKIGKFGIGFKSVYSYTMRPEIHSGDEHFSIEHYVRPYPAEIRNIGTAWTTLLVFPFNHNKISSRGAFEEIGRHLQTMHTRTFLFLRSIREMEWEIEKGSRGIYRRDEADKGSVRRVRVERQKDELSFRKRDWLVFERLVTMSDITVPIKVEVAYFLTRDDPTAKERIEALTDSNLMVFFPTKVETHLGFLIQGPFHTTPARNDIREDDPWNRLLLRETALLVVDSLMQLKDMGILTVDLLKAMPIRPADFPPDGHFRPIYEHVRSAFATQPLLPTADGVYTSAKLAKLARGTDLIHLLSGQNLKLLFQENADLKWLPEDITADKAADLRIYLRQELGIEEVTPETMASRFTASFIQQQTDQWIIRFYSYLTGQEALWRRARQQSGPGLLRNKPIIRLQDGSHVIPFRNTDAPNAYLPRRGGTTDFPIVKPEIAENDRAKAFLITLGLSEPDSADEVLDRVIPRYVSGAKIELVDHERDIAIIQRALSTSPQEKRAILVQRLQATPMFLAVREKDGSKSFRRPVNLYRRTKELETFFCDSKDAWFLDESVPSYASLKSEWPLLGLSTLPRLIERSDTLSTKERIKIAFDHFGGLTNDIGVIDYDIDGLGNFLANFGAYEVGQSEAKALILWNFLLSHLAAMPMWDRQSFAKGKYSWFYRTQRQASFDAYWVKRVSSMRWLPGHNSLHKPQELSPGDLPSDFKQDPDLIAMLKMRVPQPAAPDIMAEAINALARQINLATADIEFILQNPDAFARWKKEEADRKRQEKARIADQQSFSYEQELRNTFSKPATAKANDGTPRPGPVANPALRRERTREEIKNAQGSEAGALQRFGKVPRKVWESKDSQVRAFLMAQYAGRCQICDNTFPKRDGEPYFEGLYLVSRTNAGWIDRWGNVICLCPTCCAKFQHGPVEAEDTDIVEQVQAFRTLREGGTKRPSLQIQLCGESVAIRYTEQHLIDFQEVLRLSLPPNGDDQVRALSERAV